MPALSIGVGALASFLVVGVCAGRKAITGGQPAMLPQLDFDFPALPADSRGVLVNHEHAHLALLERGVLYGRPSLDARALASQGLGSITVTRAGTVEFRRLFPLQEVPACLTPTVPATRTSTRSSASSSGVKKSSRPWSSIAGVSRRARRNSISSSRSGLRLQIAWLTITSATRRSR